MLKKNIHRDYIVIKIPFPSQVQISFFCIIVLALSSICFFIIYPLLVYVRESKKKAHRPKGTNQGKGNYYRYHSEKSNIYAWKYIEKTNAFICDKRIL